MIYLSDNHSRFVLHRLFGQAREEVPLLTPLLRSYFDKYLHRQPLQTTKDRIINVLTRELNPDVPQLYMASRKDTIVPFAATLDQAQLQAKLQLHYQQSRHQSENQDQLPLFCQEVQKVSKKSSGEMLTLSMRAETVSFFFFLRQRFFFSVQYHLFFWLIFPFIYSCSLFNRDWG